MADAEREARVKLTTQADLAGAKEFNKEIENLSKQLDGATTASKESARATEDLAKKKGTLKDAVKGLAFEFPALARVIGFVTSPLTIFTAAIGVAAAKVVEWAAAVQAAGRRQAEMEAIRANLSSVKEILATMRWQDAIEGMRGMGAAAEASVAAVRKLNAGMQDSRARMDALAQAKLDLEKQRIRTALAKGEISEEEAGRQMAAADEAAEQAAGQRAIAAMQTDVALKRQLFNQLGEHLRVIPATSDEEIARLKQGVEVATGRVGAAEDELKNRGTQLRDEISEIGGIRSAFLKGQGITPQDQMKFFGGLFGLISDEEKERRIDDAIESRQREVDSLEAAVPFEKGKLRQAEFKLKRAEGHRARAGKIIEARDQLREEIQGGEAEIGARTEFNAQISSIRGATRAAALDEDDAKRSRKAAATQRGEESKLNQALTTEMQRRGTVDMVDTLLQLQQQVTTSTNEVLRSHRQKLEQLQRQILDQRSD